MHYAVLLTAIVIPMLGICSATNAAPAVDAFTAAFVSGVDKVCSASWSQVLTEKTTDLTAEERQTIQTKMFAAGGFLRGVEQADVANLTEMKAAGIPGRAQVAGNGKVYAMIFGPQPECVVGGFGAPLLRAEAVAELKKSGWSASALTGKNPWMAYKALGDAKDTVLLLRAVESSEPAPPSFRANVIAAPRSAFRAGVLEAMTE